MIILEKADSKILIKKATIYRGFLVVIAGIEPATRRFSVCCSTN
jgi:hypothetical protein